MKPVKAVHLLVLTGAAVSLMLRPVGAELVRRPLFQTPFTAWVFDEGAVAGLSQAAWGEVYNLFDVPSGFCMLPGGVDVFSESFFVMDTAQDVIRFFGTRDDGFGNREIRWFRNYGTGRGTGIGEFDRAQAITMNPYGQGGPACVRNFYVLDTGNARIQKLEFSFCDRSLTHLSYIINGDIPGYGPMNNPQDIDCVLLKDDGNQENDLIVVADTYNHRVIGLAPNGTVKWALGSGPGEKAGEFCFPWAVTGIRQNPNDNDAFIYVADRGNNRIVRLYQDDLFNIRWDRVMDLPTDKPRKTWDIGGYSTAGLEDIEVDAEEVHSGVWVLDSRTGSVKQLDYELTEVVSEHSDFSFAGPPLWDLELSRGTLAVNCPYTTSSGLEIFEVRGSIDGLSVSPPTFEPPLEWVDVTMTVPIVGILDVWVETTAGAMVDSLLWDWPVYPGTEFAVWDGKNWQGATMAPGTYRIRTRLDDPYWNFTSTDQIDVTMAANNSIAIISSHTEILDPDWSPDGTRLVYGAKEGAAPGIYVYDVASQLETNLTAGEDGNRHIQPAWSPDGKEILWTKEMGLYSFHYLNVMASDGSGLVMLSDTVGALPAWFWEDQPRWRNGHSKYSYVRHVPNPRIDQFYLRRMGQEEPPPFMTTSEWLSDTQWSPNGRYLAYTSDGIEYLSPNSDILEILNMETGHASRIVTAPGPDGLIWGLDWSPDGQRLAFVHYGNVDPRQGVPELQWSVRVVSATGGPTTTASGLSSGSAGVGEGVSWSPDGTKLVFPVKSTSNVDLVVADYERMPTGAYPAALITVPLPLDTLRGVAAIIGTVDENVGVNGSVLSVPSGYTVEWGPGPNPETWSQEGIYEVNDCFSQAPDCIVVLDTLALWNTGVVEPGMYTVRLTAIDGADANVVRRLVYVHHETLEVASDGSKPFTSIQGAIDAAMEGDEVLVYPGTYAENLTLRGTIDVIAAGAGAEVIGSGSTFTVRAEGLNYPVTLKGFVIKRAGPPTYQTNGSAIYVNSCSLSVVDCTIEGHRAVEGGGVKIVGNAAPTFIRCVFVDNAAYDGGALRMVESASGRPAPRFADCIFSGNQATNQYGGVMYLTYWTQFAPGARSPVFSGCLFEGNTAKNGAVAYFELTHSPVFSRCTFSDNSVTFVSSGAGLFSGYSAGAIFNYSTFAQNDGAVAPFHLLNFPGVSGILEAIKVTNCIFAENADGIAIAPSYTSHYEVVNSDFFGNHSDDTNWLTAGTACISEDPAFTNLANDEFTLWAHSACAAEVSPVGQIGAHAVAGAPDASVTMAPAGTVPPDTLVFGCPAGDADSLTIALDFLDGVMTRDLQRTELELALPYQQHGLYSDTLIVADSSAVAPNYATTVTHPWVGGIGIDSIAVLLNGYELGQRARVRRRGPDVNNDGVVDLLDFALWGPSHPSTPGSGNWNAEYDFNADEAIDLVDFSLFGEHFLHEHPFSTPIPAPALVNVSTASIDIDFEEHDPLTGPRQVKATIHLSGVEPGFRAMAIMLRNDNPKLEFLNWQPSPGSQMVSLATETMADGRPAILVGVIGRKGSTETSFTLGAANLKVTSQEFELGAEDLAMVRADILGGTSQILQVSRDRVSRSHTTPVYVDALSQNYPNPFNPATTIVFTLLDPVGVKLDVFDVTGARVRTLVDKQMERGKHRIVWDGRDSRGTAVASGVYFYRLVNERFSATRKMVLVR